MKSNSPEMFERELPRPKPRSKPRKRIGSFVIRIVILFAIFEAGWLLIANLTQRPVVAQWGSIEQGCWTEALFLREETVLTAPAGGQYTPHITSGDRVPQGEIVGVIEQIPSGDQTNQDFRINVSTSAAGYWFNEVDGWEERWNLDQAQNSYPTVGEEDFNRNYPLQRVKTEIKPGEICGKVVSPFRQFIAVEVDPRRTGLPDPDVTWKLIVRNDPNPVTVLKRIKLSKTRMIVILNDTSLKLRQPERKLQVYLVYRKASGISLPVQAIFKKGKSYYVKMIKGVGYRRQKVELTASDGERAIIKGIDDGTIVLAR